MATTVQVTFDCADPLALARFWATALDYVIPDPPDGSASWEDFLRARGVPEEEWNAAAAAEDPDGTGPRLYFQRVPEGKVAKNRVHLDLRAAPGLEGGQRMTALEARATELVALDATRIERHEPGPMSGGFIVMTDPEGNEFCLD